MGTSGSRTFLTPPPVTDMGTSGS